jgi:hypothetical protein
MSEREINRGKARGEIKRRGKREEKPIPNGR